MFQVLRRWSERYFANEEAIGLLLIITSVLVLMFYARQMMVPVVASLILAYLLQGVVTQFTRRMPRSVAIYLTYSLFIGACLGTMLFIIPVVVKQFTSLLVELPKIFNELQIQLASLQKQYPQFLSEEQISKLLELSAQYVGGWGQTLFSLSLSTLPNLFALMIYGVLIPLLVFFFLRDKNEILQWFVQFLPNERPLMNAVWVEMNQQVANYVRGKAVEVAFVGGASLISFLSLGLNYAALLALGVGLSVIVPYIGAVAITFPVLLVAYWQFGVGAEFMYVFIAYSVIQFIDGNVLVPLLFSEAVDMHPVAIIVAVLFFGGMWGLWGVFFAIPLATLIKAILAVWPNIQGSAGADENLAPTLEKRLDESLEENA